VSKRRVTESESYTANSTRHITIDPQSLPISPSSRSALSRADLAVIAPTPLSLPLSLSLSLSLSLDPKTKEELIATAPPANYPAHLPPPNRHAARISGGGAAPSRISPVRRRSRKPLNARILTDYDSVVAHRRGEGEEGRRGTANRASDIASLARVATPRKALNRVVHRVVTRGLSPSRLSQSHPPRARIRISLAMTFGSRTQALVRVWPPNIGNRLPSNGEINYCPHRRSRGAHLRGIPRGTRCGGCDPP